LKKKDYQSYEAFEMSGAVDLFLVPTYRDNFAAVLIFLLTGLLHSKILAIYAIYYGLNAICRRSKGWVSRRLDQN
jgi:hypothetical protein